MSMRVATKLGLVLLLTLSLASCASMGNGTSDGAASGQQGPGSNSAQQLPPPVIPEFGDVPIPRALSRRNDQSFIYEAPGTTIGVVVYTGRVTPDSVNGFFREQMPIHGWRLLNAFTGENSDLFYLKGNRSCQISVKPGIIDTKVTIKVGPTATGPSHAKSHNARR